MNHIDLALLVANFVVGNPKIVFKQYEEHIVNNGDGVFVRMSNF